LRRGGHVMRGQIPVLIAVALVAGIIMASMAYASLRLASARISTGNASEWRALEDQLDSVILAAIARASPSASQAFLSTFNGTYRDSLIVGSLANRPDESRVNTLWSRYNCNICYGRRGASSPSWVLYNFNDFLCPGNCASNYTSTGFSEELGNFNYSLRLSAGGYSYAVSRAVLSAISNWANALAQLGYYIPLASVNASSSYATSFASYPNGTSISNSSLRVSASVDVYSPWGGYRRLSRYVELGVTAVFDGGLDLYRGVLLPVRVSAYVDLSGTRSWYIVDPSQASLTIYSTELTWLSYLDKGFVDGKTNASRTSLVSSYYYGNGTSLLYFAVPASNKNLWDQALTVINRTVLSCGETWWTYIWWIPISCVCCCCFPPRSATPSGWQNQEYMVVTVAYLWAGLLKVNVAGADLFVGVKIVHKVRFWAWACFSYSPDYVWVLDVDVTGDERT
ncbi:MAG: hypothetical protein ABWK00_05900, partial [Desulfurococcaceae archaeon]